MPAEPSIKRAIAFIDGPNLFHAAKDAFGYRHPNYDVVLLSQAVCQQQGWQLTETRFYTGIPDIADDAFWNHFWVAKLAAMGRQNVQVYSRSLRYRNQTFQLPGGGNHTILVGQEKGIDIRLALDVVRAVHRNRCDVAVIFSQDQDLSEVADEVRGIAQDHQRWIKIASAFPDSPTRTNHRGVNRTDWIKLDRTTYDARIDAADYRPKRSQP